MLPKMTNQSSNDLIDETPKTWLVRVVSFSISCSICVLLGMAIWTWVQTWRADAIELSKFGRMRQIRLAVIVASKSTGDLFNDPTLSWRVKLLPYIGQRDLLDSYELSEKWDSTSNRMVLDSSPKFFCGNGSQFSEVLLVSPDSNNEGDREDCVSLPLLVLVDSEGFAVPWTRPTDLTVSEFLKTARLNGHIQGNDRVIVLPMDAEDPVVETYDELIRKLECYQN